MHRSATVVLLAVVVAAATRAEVVLPPVVKGPAGARDDPHPVKEHQCIHDDPSHQAAIAADLKRSAHVVQRRSAEQERRFRAQSPQPIRIVISTEDLTTSSQYCSAAGQSRPDFRGTGGTLTCSADDVLTTTKRTLLTNTIIPAALARLQAHINVNRFTSNLVTSGSCSDMTVPASHSSTGVANADYVLYVAAGPITGSTLAFAGSCQTDGSTGRPIVGRANFDPEHLAYESAAQLEGLIDTAVHEILHALGFSGGFFGTGGRTSTTTKRGKTVTELDSTMSALLTEARSYTGCSTLSGVEIEDEGSSGSAGSHFERRLYKDEVMTAAGGSKLSSFSLLALQDLGVGYTVDTTNAEAMEWGKGDGCGFHTEKCDTVAGGRGKYFCFEDSSSVKGCTYDYKSVGYCTVGTYGSDLPSYFQYYSGEPKKGGTSTFMDACPYFQGYSNRNCTDASYPATDSDYIFGWTYATDSRCHIVTDMIRNNFSPGSSGGRCLQTRCTGGSTVEFKVNGSAYLTCPSDGATVSSLPNYQGSVTCPTAANMCASFGTTTTTTAAPSGPTTTSAATPPPTTTSSAPTTTTAATPPPTTTAASGSSCDTSYLLTGNSPSPVLSVESINAILTEHNNARRTVSPAAAVMPMLTWDQELANFAQEYMDGCPGMTHSPSSMRQNASRFGFSYVGENLAAGTSSTTYGLANGGKSSTAAWNDEMADWTYPNTCASGKVCGHYTQVIWAATTKVGCGYKYCASQPYKNYWSCVYGPGGNYGGQDPYPQSSGTPAACQVQSGNPTPTPMPSVAPYTPAPPTPSTTTTTTPAPSTTTTTTTQAATTTTTTGAPTPPPTTTAAGGSPTSSTAAASSTGAASTTTNVVPTTTAFAAATSTAAASNGTAAAATTTTTAAAGVATTTSVPPTAPPTTTATATTTTDAPATTTTSSPTTTSQPTTTPAPTPAAPRLIVASVRIRGSSFGALLNNATRRALLAAAVRRDIARALGVDFTLVVITDMRLGSLIVNFTVVSRATATETGGSNGTGGSTTPAPTTQLSAEALSAALTQASSDSTWLEDTSALYATEANSTETIAVESTSSEVVLVSIPSPSPTPSGPPAPPTWDTTDGGCDGACMLFYTAAFIAVMAVAGVVIGIVLFVRKRSASGAAATKGAKTAAPAPTNPVAKV